MLASEETGKGPVSSSESDDAYRPGHEDDVLLEDDAAEDDNVPPVGA